MAPPQNLSENSRIVHPEFLQKHSNKKDLLRRLRKVVQVLQQDESIEAHSPEWPGLASTADLLFAWLDHKDKQVRLLSLHASLELLAVYAPEVPLDDHEILVLFQHIVRQLGNLAHCVDASQPHFATYLDILRLLADVKMGAILTEIVLQKHSDMDEHDEQVEHDDDDDDDEEHDEAKEKKKKKGSSGSGDDAAAASENTTALEVLVDFMHTLLHSVRREHPAEVLELACESIIVLLEEYHTSDTGIPIPLKILDELLIAIGQGPTVKVTKLVTVPAKSSSKTGSGSKRSQQQQQQQQIPQQVEEPNPTYRAATSIIRSQLNRLTSPLEHLLNGLLHADPVVVEQSSILHTPSTDNDDEDNSGSSNDNMDVYRIVYELHRVAPSLLTTVLGTVSAGLSSTDTQQRSCVTKLLGRLLVASPDLGKKYAACYRDWWQRSQDVEPSIRQHIVTYAVRFLEACNKNNSSSNENNENIAEAHQVLIAKMTQDPIKVVRLAAIHQVCDLAYNNQAGGNTVSPQLLRAVGTRIQARDAQERKDALTGLSQVYWKMYMQRKLQDIHQAGDDCPLEKLVAVMPEIRWKKSVSRSRRSRSLRQRRDSFDWHDDEDDDDVESVDPDDELYGWIPRRVLESFYYTDEVDPEMRSRVFQIWDDVLLGSELSSKKKLSPTARAVGLVLLIASLRPPGAHPLLDSSNTSAAYHCLEKMMEARSTLQQTVSLYIDARAKVRDLPSGTEEALVADARAVELLESISTMTAPPTGKSAADVLELFHGARDKHIFRILATICDPTHSTKARMRALDELPKRTKSLSDDVSNWVKNLVRRCAMGSTLNMEVVGHCVLLAQECFREDDIPSCAAFLSCVKTACEAFPSLCSSTETFTTLTELFSESRAVNDPELKKEVEDSGIVTALSAILSKTVSSGETHLKDDSELSADELQSQLLQMCTRDGTPEQARNAVYTLSRLICPALEGGDEVDVEASKKSFTPLLTSLTSPSRMKVSGSGDESFKLISILSSLSALAECAPDLFETQRGEKAITFALESVLLGRGYEDEESSDEEAADMGRKQAKTPSSTRKKLSVSPPKSGKHATEHMTPTGNTSLLEDESLSISCRRLCAAIEFLVSYIRSTMMKTLIKAPANRPDTSCLSTNRVKSVFDILIQLLQDKGLPPSSHDRRLCRARQDRAALRQCATIHILRLCDPRLGLEQKYLSPAMWYTLSESFLDEERSVREAVIGELSAYLTGVGDYRSETSSLQSKAPSLRFVALVCLCSDGDHGSEHDPANGNAANVGKCTSSAKMAAMQCIAKLRKVSDATYTQCRAMGKEAEQKFETKFKMLVMPEYTVPYTIHLLTHRSETPYATVVNQDEEYVEDEEMEILDDASRHRVLRRRLKLLFEPLVQSLGDSADNISFLLRMVELIGKNFHPIDVSIFNGATSRPSIESPSDARTDSNNAFSKKRAATLQEKLKTICGEAREVLLSFVKKDVNLTPYPGTVQIPRSLFRQRTAGRPVLSQPSQSSSQGSSQSSPKARTPAGARPALLSETRWSASKPSQGTTRRDRKSVSPRVHFSPDLVDARPTRASLRGIRSGTPDSSSGFGNVSPIGSSKSPGSAPSKSPGSAPSKSGDTLGTTPPSALRGATMRSTAPDQTASPAASSTSSPGPRTRSRASLSPVVLEEIVPGRDSLSSEEGKTTSETQSKTQSQTQSTKDSRSAGGKKFKPVSSDKSKSSKRRSVPKQIKINRGTFSASLDNRAKGKSKRQRASVDDFEFLDEVGEENLRISGRRTRTRRK